MNIIPFGKRVLIEKIKVEEKRKSGLILLENSTEKNYETGIITSLSKDTEILSLFSLNNKIIFKKGAGIEVFNEKYLLDIEDILGIFSEK